MANHSALTLYYHPLASFCHKVLIALYESGTPFQGRVVDLGDPASAAALLEHWPVGKIPVLRDQGHDETVPETSVIIEYLASHDAKARALLPVDPAAALEVRLWDRFFDNHVELPMQKIVLDRLRPPGQDDPFGVRQAEAALRTAYALADARLRARTASGAQWAAGDTFTMADCAAAPALFYADIVVPFSGDHPHLAAYFERLLERPSVTRTIAEARPFFHLFPLRDRIPARFLGGPPA